MHQNGALGVEQIQKSRQDDDDEQRLQPPQDHLQMDPRNADAGDEEDQHQPVGEKRLCQKQRHDKDDDSQ